MSLDTAKAVVTLRTLTSKFVKTVQSATPFYPTVCNIMPSDGADENYAMLGDMPGVREWIGDRLFKELRAGTYLLANKEWESSLLIKKNDIADDRMGLYPTLMENLANEAAYHPDELFFTALLAGESQACFDSQYFFDTDHAWGDSGTQSNLLTYNASDHTAVTATEFLAAYHAAREKMVGYKNDQGKLLNRPVIGRMNQFLVVVPPKLRLAATAAFTSQIISNSTNVVLDMPTIVESAYCTSNVKWWLFNLQGALRPFIFQARRPLGWATKGVDDRETKDIKFMTDARYNVGYCAWWTAVQTEFN